MNRLLYEKSVSYKGHLIIPFIFGKADSEAIYSYKLLSELDEKENFISQKILIASIPIVLIQSLILRKSILIKIQILKAALTILNFVIPMATI